MSRVFSGAQRMHRAPVVTGNLAIQNRFTMACWFKPTSLSNAALMALNHSGNSLHTHYLNHGGSVNITSTDGANGVAAVGTVLTNVWQHAAGVWSETDSRTPYFNGTKGTSSTASINATGMNELNLGVVRYGGTFQIWYSGLMAIPAIWNVALSDAEITALASGVKPDQVRPQSLVGYHLFDPRILDVVGNSWTNVSTAESHDNPPLR